MSFRKEKKFRLTNSELRFLKSKLIDKGMKVLYPKRTINSCYFDTKNLKMFFDSEDGLLPRKKIRLRWYSDLSKVNKETKVSSIEGRFKISNQINISSISNLDKIKLFDRDYGNLYAKIIVKYCREYFIHKNLRITFDTNIEYFNLLSTFKSKLLEKESVMEVKTPLLESDDHIDNIVNIQTSRFSKYCRGIMGFYY